MVITRITLLFFFLLLKIGIRFAFSQSYDNSSIVLYFSEIITSDYVNSLSMSLKTTPCLSSRPADLLYSIFF